MDLDSKWLVIYLIDSLEYMISLYTFCSFSTPIPNYSCWYSELILLLLLPLPLLLPLLPQQLLLLLLLLLLPGFNLLRTAISLQSDIA